MTNQEIVMETTHGRKEKCKTEFKAVVNRVLVSGLVLATLMSSTVMPAMAATGRIGDGINAEDSISEIRNTIMVSSFWDVKQGEWYYSSVMKMTEMGYFAGKGTNANGEATFGPNEPMTRAEFMTVVARILYDEDNLKSYDGPWWSVYYTVLVDGGVITTAEFAANEEYLNQAMPRQEMAMLAIRAMQEKGETFGDFYESNIKSAIPDINDVGNAYINYVLRAYSEGILAGKDDTGRFSPTDTLTRAEATTVLYRIVEPSVREKKDFSKPLVTATRQQQIIHEGEQSKRYPAQEGDIFIKKDGTQIVLKKGPNGIVGEGQGVAPDLGMYGTNGGYVTVSNGGWENQINLMGFENVQYYVDSFGKSLNNQYYIVNATTGEGHWSSDSSVLERAVPKPNYDGTYNGELSKDAYSLYVWDNDIGVWMSNIIR